MKQILSFSRKEDSNRKPHHLCRLVDENMKSLRSTIPASVRVNVNIPQTCRNDVGKCKMVLVDPVQIQQLLLNLCVNAVHAMDEKGLLEVSVEEIDHSKEVPEKLGLKSGKYELLTVSDTGPGIGSEIVEKIFDPFFTTKDVGKGTGMGLSVVHGIVESSGGKIFVETETGNGTTFLVYFPITDKRPEESTSDNAPLPRGNEKILLVDDEEKLTQTAKSIIERQGYSVTAKTDSTEALALYKSDPTQFDLVITDQTMPNITGAELAEQMLQLRPDLPVILLTGYSSKIDKEKASKIGVKEFATKPLDTKDIAILIRKVLDGPDVKNR